MNYFKTLFSITLLTIIPPCFSQEILEEVVVTASKTEVPLKEVGVAISVIDSKDIQLRGYQSVADLLRTQPGVAVSNSGGQGKITAVRIRGEEAYRTILVIDGIETTDITGPQSGPRMEQFSNSGDIEKIEVLRGPQGFIYGADAGGVINIITRSSTQDFDGAATMEVGRYNSKSAKAYISAGNDTANAFLSISNNRTNGFDLSADNASDNNEPDGYKNQTLHSKFGFTVSEKIKTELVLRDTSSTSEYDGCWTATEQTNDCLGHYDQSSGRFAINYSSNSTQQQIAFQQNTITQDSIAEGDINYSSKGQSQKVEYLGKHAINQYLSSTWGGDFKKDEMKPSPDTQKENEALYERSQYGIFGELRVNIKDSVYTSLGLRYDDNEDFGEHLSARVSTAYLQALPDKLTIKYRASYGNGFRAPSLSEISYNGSRGYFMPSLTEETSSGYDLGIDIYTASGINAQITYFNQMIEDEIFFDPIAWTGYLQEDGISHSKGAELALEYPLMESLVAFVNYTYNETLTSEDLQRFRRPKQYGNIGTKVLAFDDRLNVLLNIRFSKDSIDVYNVELKDYYVIDISANYQLRNNVTVFARVENAADRHYQEVSGYNTAEAAFYFGIKTPL